MSSFADRPPTQRKKGFTLIELLVALAVVGVLSGLAVAGLEKAREAAVTAEATTGARSLIHAFLLTPAENNGRYMIGYGDTGDDLNPSGHPPIHSSDEHAKRYPWRIAPMLDQGVASLFVGAHQDYFEAIASKSAYHSSLHPSFGMNSIFVGGHYDGRKHSPGYRPGPRSRSDATFPNEFWVLRPAQAHNPSELIVFASSLYSAPADFGETVGFFRVNPPKSPFLPNWGPYDPSIPARMGQLSLEYGDHAVVARLDGSVALLDETELRDMRRWSNQAAIHNDPDFDDWER